jgi:hypothetical protein
VFLDFESLGHLLQEKGPHMQLCDCCGLDNRKVGRGVTYLSAKSREFPLKWAYLFYFPKELMGSNWRYTNELSLLLIDFFNLIS